MEKKQNTIVGVIAPKGSGKTFLTHNLVRPLPRVACFDFNHEDAYAEIATEIILGSPFQFAKAIDRPEFRCVYRPLDYDPAKKFSPGFDWFCRLCFERGDLWVVVDEAHQICRPQSIPGSFETLARVGRHQRVSLIYITQSFSAVQGALTENTDTFLFFRIHYPWDIEGIRKRCGPEIAQRVQELRKLDIERGIGGEILRWKDTGDITVSDNLEPFTLPGQSVKDISGIDEHGESLADAGSARTRDLGGIAGDRDPEESEELVAGEPHALEDAESGNDPEEQGLPW